MTRRPRLCTEETLTLDHKWSFRPCKYQCTADGMGLHVSQHCSATFRCGGPAYEGGVSVPFPCSGHYCSRSSTNCSCACSLHSDYSSSSWSSARSLVNRTLISKLRLRREGSGQHFLGALGLTRSLFDGCGAVYLDCGTNIGSRLGALFDEHPGVSRPGQSWFSKYLDQRNHTRAHTCAVGFEPNPIHRPTLQRIERHHRERGKRIKIVEAAIGANNSVQRFFSDGQQASKANYWGSSLLMWSKEHVKHANSSSVLVPVLSLETLLRTVALPWGRMLPLIMKLDIEGAEYTALPPAIKSGVLCKTVDALQIEVHSKYLKYSVEDERSRSAIEPWFKNAHRKLLQQLKWVGEQHKQGLCRTAVSYIDEAQR